MRSCFVASLVLVFAVGCGRRALNPSESSGSLVFAVQPADVGANRPELSVSVELQDSDGNILTGQPVEIALELASNPDGAGLNAAPVTTVDGVATFSDLQIDIPGTDYELVAHAVDLKDAFSDPFDVLGNRGPTIEVSMGTGADVFAGDLVRVQITVTDPEGDDVSLRLLNPPAGFEPIGVSAAASPLVVVRRWRVPEESGRRYLYLHAEDDFDPVGEADATLSLRLNGATTNDGMVVGDVTGDGRPDLVAGGRGINVGAVADSGAIFVFFGKDEPTQFPDALLFVDAPTAGDALGDMEGGQGIQLADVNGDGQLDVVAGAALADKGAVADAGAIYVWLGPVTSGFPDAVLTVDTPSTTDELGNVLTGQGIVIGDVTTDGIDDIIAGAALSNEAGTDRGAVYIWHGGPGLIGEVSPTAVLLHPNSADGDELGNVESGQGILLADVTGDGFDDLIVGCSQARNDDRGEIYVWKGAPDLTGKAPPTARLQRADQTNADRVGFVGQGQGILTGDVTGDGILDVVAGASLADEGGVTDSGAVYVWEGGMGLQGDVDALAELYENVAPTNADQLSDSGSRRGILLADVTADDVLDVIVGAFLSDVAVANGGAVYVWEGGMNLMGDAPAPKAILHDSNLNAGAGLGATSGYGLMVEDLTGDGTLDLIAAAPNSLLGGGVGMGSVHIWKGGGGLSGPDATAVLVTQVDSDNLATSVAGQGIQIADVTGDGELDVVAGDPDADTATNQVGLIAVWPGPDWTGMIDASILQVDSPIANDQLGFSTTGHAIQLVDVTGDGVRDVIALAERADGSQTDEGYLYLWRGRAALGEATVTPLPEDLRMEGSPSTSSQRLGDSENGDGLVITDVTGDGIADILVCTWRNDDAALTDVGALFFWEGGSLDAQAKAMVRPAVPVAGDNLCRTSGQPIRIVDFDGDGILDALVAGREVAEGGVNGGGAVYLLQGGSAFPTASIPLYNPLGSNGDSLTEVN